MSNILVVHHDADLYGADKSLLRTARALKLRGHWPIVLLPHAGPLVERLVSEGLEVHIGPVIKVSRQRLTLRGLPMVLLDALRSLRFIKRIVAGRPIDLVYTNSVAALGGALWAALHGVPRLWHVREIVVAPRIATRGFPFVLRALGGWCVCNSHATRDWITGAQPTLASRSSVIWNGLEPITVPPPEAASALRESLGFDKTDVVVTLVGRINRWKGQSVLVDAARLLAARGQLGLRFLIVGDVADGQDHFREAMLARITANGLDGIVKWHPFTPDVDLVWSASDVAVVPSVDPEPFGRVAIEAMAHSLPVVATAHGGLAEIVEHERTGLLVQPGSAEELATAIGRLAASSATRAAFGNAGRLRQQQQFSQSDHDDKMADLVGGLCGTRTGEEHAAASQ
jgi:glycosyltransferase involved in cell wall biosynthesis